MRTATSEETMEVVAGGNETSIRTVRARKEANAIDAMLYRLQNYQNEKQLGTLCLGVTSCKAKTGVSTLASSSSIRASHLGMGNVLLIDGNLIRPVAHRHFGVSLAPGLADYLVEGGEIVDFIKQSKDRDLDILTAGSSNLRDIAFAPNALQLLFNELRTRYQTIIVDIPSFDNVGNGFFMSTQVDGLLVVLDPRINRARETKRFVDFLDQNDIKVIGGVLNRYLPSVPRWIRRWL